MRASMSREGVMQELFFCSCTLTPFTFFRRSCPFLLKHVETMPFFLDSFLLGLWTATVENFIWYACCIKSFQATDGKQYSLFLQSHSWMLNERKVIESANFDLGERVVVELVGRSTR